MDKNKSRWLAQSTQKGQNLDQIYAFAHIRQLKLVKKCFDACIKTLEEQEQLSYKVKQFILKIGDEQLIIDSNDANHMKQYREQLCDFLETNSSLILKDGNVKSKERTAYKIANQLGGKADLIDDLNRVTIISDNYEMIQHFTKNLNKSCHPDEVCASPEWRLLSCGVLTKGNDILIDGYPAEIHVNETNQFLLSQVLTHKVYEVLRLNSTDKNFNELYSHLPIECVKQAMANKDNIPHEQKDCLVSLLKELKITVEANKNNNVEIKKKALLNFHQKAHQQFISLSQQPWIEVYCEALKKFNDKQPLETQIQIDKSIQKDYNIYINQTKNLNPRYISIIKGKENER